MLPFVDLHYVKTGIGSTTESDERIFQLIEEAEATIREYCRIPSIEPLPTSYKRNLVRMVEFDLNRKAGVVSESLSRHSVTYAQDYPVDLYKGLKRRLSWS